MTAVEAEGEAKGEREGETVTSMFMSPEFGFDIDTSSALARLYDYIAHGTELPANDIKKWFACGVFDPADNKRVQMPGPIDDCPSWTLLGMLWNGKISKVWHTKNRHAPLFPDTHTNTGVGVGTFLDMRVAERKERKGKE